ncbi:MAG: hypothetical protein HWN68_14170 [Desulfobacterales bacterium]|nr:hypothetical protein [Desulfobacterales bacterium]
MMRRDDPQFQPPGTFDYFRKAFEIVKLNKPAMDEVATDRNAIRFGLVVTATGGVLAVLPESNFLGIAFAAVYSVVALFLFSALLHLSAGFSKGKEEFMGFVRIMALSGILDWTVIIPMVGLFATIWSIVVAVVATRQIYDVGGGKATLCVLLSAFSLWMISLILFAGPLGSLYDVPGR